MKSTIYKIAALTFAVASMSACSLDEYNPSQKTGDEILATFDGLKGLQSYCYSSLYGQLFSVYDFLSVAEGGTDCWITPAGNPDYAKQVIYYDGLATNTNATNKLFGQAYSMIGNCNAVVNRAELLTDGNEKDIPTLVAEARCLRAFYYSILVNTYGNVTLTLEESSQDPILTPQRNSIEELYTQIIDDLKFAANNLEDTPYDNNRARVTKKTALGLLARVYAQGGGEYGLTEEGVSYWQRAKEVAEDMILAYGDCLYDDVEDVWAPANNRNNKEAYLLLPVRMLRIWRTGMLEHNVIITLLICIQSQILSLFILLRIIKIIGMDVPIIIRWHLPNICWIVLMLIMISGGKLPLLRLLYSFLPYNQEVVICLLRSRH